MLNSQFVVEHRPAAQYRRPLLYGALLASALWLGGCGERPAPDVAGARRAVRVAILLARPSAPQQARYLERMAADAETATAGEIADAGQAGRAQAAWLRAVIAARDVARGVRSQRDSARRRYEALFASVSSEMNRANGEIAEAGMGRREAAAMGRAKTAVGTALQLAAGGRHAAAADKLQTARDLLHVVHDAWQSLHSRFRDPVLLSQWQSWAGVALRESRMVTRPVILIDKLRRQLIVYQRGDRIVIFSAELGANGLRRKAHAGDSATPEGIYRVVERKQGHATNFYKALLINYPNDEDRARFADAKRAGTIPRRAGIGSMIEIHGLGGTGRDWTEGCVALTNSAMDWLYDRVPVGTLVVIVGTV